LSTRLKTTSKNFRSQLPSDAEYSAISHCREKERGRGRWEEGVERTVVMIIAVIGDGVH